ncbi:MAG: NfeD family protein [Sarcina sp.]
MTVDQEFSNEALMKFEGIYWTFKNTGIESIHKGDKVKITGILGNKLLVEKI